MEIYRKNIIWHQLAQCKCGNNFWCKEPKPQKTCESCKKQKLDNIITQMEKAGLLQEVESLKLILDS